MISSHVVRGATAASKGRIILNVGSISQLATSSLSSFCSNMKKVQQHHHYRCFSSTIQKQQQQQQLLPSDDPQVNFQPKPPSELNLEMAQSIQTANQLILKYGVGKQRLELLAQTSKSSDAGMPLTLKWQRMMEIYLGAQLHIVASLGYETNEQGIMQYTQQLGRFVASCSPEVQEDFRKRGRDTWREMLLLAFGLDKEEVLKQHGEDEMTIVDARNLVHKVASRLIEPEILEAVAKRVAGLPPRKYCDKTLT
jgi:hypothetical protein